MSLLSYERAGLTFIFGCFFFGASVFFADAETSAKVLSVTLTANKSSKAISVASGGRVELAWSAKDAKDCTGNWVAYRLKNSGTQTFRITKSRTFTVTCTSRDKLSNTASVSVSVARATLPSAVSGVSAPTQKTEIPLLFPVSGAVTQKQPFAGPNIPNQSSIRVLSPNIDEVWHQGETRELMWLANDVPAIRPGFVIDVVDSRGTEYVISSTSLLWTARKFFWKIPASFPEGERYRVRVWVTDKEDGDMSDSYFTVARTLFGGPTRLLPCGVSGDADKNQVITSADSDQIAYFVANPSAATPDDFKRADVDLNGVISSADIIELNRYIGGTFTTLSACSFGGVSIDLLANGKAETVTVPENSVVTLTWTSSGGRCLFENSYFPSSGSVVRSMGGGPTTLVYTIQCLGQGSSQSATDSVTVNVEPRNRAPLITVLEKPTVIRAATSHFWNVTASDPDGRALTVTVNWGDGTASSTMASSTSPGLGVITAFWHTFATAGTYNVVTSVKDAKGAEASQSNLIIATEPPRTSRVDVRLELGALYEGFRHFLLSAPPMQ
ncbi:MAG: hypothetical protein EXS51_02470 [Candidatus Taylorbacteria bacterium]|nr:hypothetical protein [Candidatus Taylorbacteria bacterium]